MILAQVPPPTVEEAQIVLGHVVQQPALNEILMKASELAFAGASHVLTWKKFNHACIGSWIWFQMRHNLDRDQIFNAMDILASPLSDWLDKIMELDLAGTDVDWPEFNLGFIEWDLLTWTDHPEFIKLDTLETVEELPALATTYLTLMPLSIIALSAATLQSLREQADATTTALQQVAEAGRHTEERGVLRDDSAGDPG